MTKCDCSRTFWTTLVYINIVVLDNKIIRKKFYILSTLITGKKVCSYDLITISSHQLAHMNFKDIHKWYVTFVQCPVGY